VADRGEVLLDENATVLFQKCEERFVDTSPG
jgi:hypothetical protein